MASEAPRPVEYPSFTHIAVKAEWDAQKESETYVPSLYNPDDVESFIHCTQADMTQLKGVLHRFFPDKEKELVFLFIDRSRTGPKVVEELTPDGWFPHVYGPLNKDAIYAVAPVNRALMG
jgi:glutathione S-transferase